MKFQARYNIDHSEGALRSNCQLYRFRSNLDSHYSEMSVVDPVATASPEHSGRAEAKSPAKDCLRVCSVESGAEHCRTFTGLQCGAGGGRESHSSGVAQCHSTCRGGTISASHRVMMLLAGLACLTVLSTVSAQAAAQLRRRCYTCRYLTYYSCISGI